MLTISNAISALRFPLALLFFSHNIYLRFVSIILAMITDGIDGYFARKFKSATKFGAYFDPAMDKFFVYFVLFLFLIEKKINIYFGLMTISRDFALFLFGIFLLITKRWSTYEVKPVRWGKITTALQFLTLIGLNFNINFPMYYYLIFVLLSLLALIEMFFTSKYTNK
ncbi:MAG: hypothetical protein A3F40_01020 [Chlamydiae bacterium RIFCSPHIGHO2_12_FULL_27_8]|nr:MAG: hypothetical protein A3F40_01020 [Chlamydiae bacterium RIFCSPHIGHO2_12_FULL_27_8]